MRLRRQVYGSAGLTASWARRLARVPNRTARRRALVAAYSHVKQPVFFVPAARFAPGLLHLCSDHPNRGEQSARDVRVQRHPLGVP